MFKINKLKFFLLIFFAFLHFFWTMYVASLIVGLINIIHCFHSPYDFSNIISTHIFFKIIIFLWKKINKYIIPTKCVKATRTGNRTRGAQAWVECVTTRYAGLRQNCFNFIKLLGLINIFLHFSYSLTKCSSRITFNLPMYASLKYF